jgi:GMP synthase (glutamine-hydrolysing)
MGPRILVFQHHPTAPAGLIGERMAARAARVTTLDAEHGVDLPPDAADHDGLLILGGAMDALDDARCRHFPALLGLTRAYAAAGRPVVLGVCLGAAPEFGVTPLTLTPEAAADPLLAGSPPEVPAMQWHDDTFDLPAGAVPLLTGAACRNQAFRVAGLAWGFQCHLEADRRAMVEWAVDRRDTYGYADLAARLGQQAATHGEAAEAFGRRVADWGLDAVTA